ncbi:MAG: DUF4880 domain-containing protein, partial [Pseudomonadota bacterium]
MDPEPSALAREARAWVVRTMDGGISPAEQDALQRWRRTSPSHEAAFQEARRLRALANLASENVEVGPPPVLTRRRLIAGSLAAAGAFHLAGTLGMVPRWRALTADHATARGEQRRIDISPDLTIALDGDSMIDLTELPSATEVLLKAGAVYLDVQARETAPLIASAKAWQITAQEAAFALKHGADDIELACARGAVSAAGHGVRAEVVAGRAVRLSDTGMSAPRSVLKEEIAAWRGGSLIFRGAPLGDVVADVNRHRAGRIVILEEALLARQVN